VQRVGEQGAREASGVRVRGRHLLIDHKPVRAFPILFLHVHTSPMSARLGYVVLPTKYSGRWVRNITVPLATDVTLCSDGADKTVHWKTAIVVY
jgi:hypothetical protein